MMKILIEGGFQPAFFHKYFVMSMVKKFNEFIKESIWSDMQDRGTMDMVKKEDIINTNEDIKKKIKELYKEQGEGDTLDVSSLSKLIACDDFSKLFLNLDKVKQIIGLETWDVSKVTNMKGMFYNCRSLTELNISNWDVSKVTNMKGMFYKCSSLTELNISNWDVSNVTYMTEMFYDCESLTELNISNWDVSKVTDMRDMFDDCSSLTELNISNWNVSNVTDMRNMFYNCSSLTKLNISNWDVSNVTNIHYMFFNCDKLIKPKWYNE